MKSKIPTPVVVAVIVVVVAVVGFFIFKGGQTSDTAAAATEGLKTMNQGKPQTDAVSPTMAAEGAAMMGGPRAKGAR